MTDGELENKTKGDWSLFFSEVKDLYTMQDFFAFPAAFLKERLEELQNCVDLGVVEYKRSLLSRSFELIESLKYDARGFDKIGQWADRLQYGLYLSMIQHLICRGSIRIRKAKHDYPEQEKENATAPATDLKTVIADVSERLKNKPELQKNPHIKQILMQISIYKKELAETRRLAASMPREKAAGLAANFKKRVEEITWSASENHRKLLDELEPKPAAPVKGLPSYDLAPLAPLYLSQAKAFSSLASRFSFVEEQRSGARDVLIPLLGQRETWFRLMEREVKAYNLLEPFEGGERRAAMEFTREVVRILDREAEEAFR
ncbi:hypothetical protein [Marispirochaeta aestuarii]|uniref:hypothetical protein n=1 Tax=Marispirochaeta aestuarii TaxID=1963862 RepID=UPI002ABD5242|nr:hypothetical protein [Marispirochaeta aestuarii]